MTPLVRKIFESTYQKAQDAPVLADLDFEIGSNDGLHLHFPSPQDSIILNGLLETFDLQEET